MLSAETKDFLESGCALVVATVSSTGVPIASRGWGLDVLTPAGDRVRLLLDAHDVRALDNLDDSGAIAVTATNVPTLHSMQMKGRCVVVEAATGGDEARSDRYCEEFFADIEATDGTNRNLLVRLRPAGIIACEVEIDAFYDQTPGPGAGASLVQ